MHHVRVALDHHQLVDAHRPGPAHRAQIVAREIDQHHVLRALFRIGEQFLGDPSVAFVVAAARPGAGERTDARGRAVEPHQELRRRAEHRAPVVLDEEHVRRRISRADLAVEVERRAGESAREPYADLQLIRLAVADELFRLRDPR